MKEITAFINIQGQVQGLGFRPFVYRIAESLGIRGYVTNTLSGVNIVAQGKRIKEFISRLRNSPPPLAKISSFQIRWGKIKKFDRFTIRPSELRGLPKIEALPDLNLCIECRQEIFNPKDRRYYYPFINCTQCGPRYTIIESLPYDRERTTMVKFKMCPECKKEYLNPLDRRFHAEPIACPKCGPQLQVFSKDGKLIQSKIDPILFISQAIAKGYVVAIKGLGGYHIACDATNTDAVDFIRRHKERSSKPLAIMVEDIKTARKICLVSPSAAKLLLSPSAPIILLPKRKNPKISLSPLIAPNNPYLGVMLAYTPLHLLIFRRLREISNRPHVLIMTSANPPDDPIVISEKELFTKIKDMYHFALSHNRSIANRCDDSVVLMDGKESILVRRARGYVPQPIHAGKMFHVKHSTLGMGADQRNTFCLAKGDLLFLSPHIGDMSSPDTESFFMNTFLRLRSWTDISPERIVCDLHPDYHSSHLAERLSKILGAKLLRVQHHYAHILSVMVEHNLPGPVLGVACDGTGYGYDGAIWGCELLLINQDLSWARVGHLGYLQHNAGSGVIADPTLIASAYALQCGMEKKDLAYLNLPVDKLSTSPHFSVTTSSLGRLFDAVAGITGICRKARFEGEPAITLETYALRAMGKKLFRRKKIKNMPARCIYINSDDLVIIDPNPIISMVIEAKLTNQPPELIAFWFHQVLARVLKKAIVYLAKKYNISNVCLSGGSFQNSLLRNCLKRGLRRAHLNVYHNQKVPLNDGGIALGQVVANRV